MTSLLWHLLAVASQITLALASPYPLHNTTSHNTTSPCSPASFQHITLPNTDIHTITAAEVHNFTWVSLFTLESNLPATYTGLAFCNVTIAYSHEHHNDTINVNVWLPLPVSSTAWNGRFQGTSGGGWLTNLGATVLGPALGQGYAAAGTDGGHSLDATLSMPAYWALDDNGEVDEQLLLDWAYLAVYEMTVLGKAVTAAFYGVAPHHTYWHGCSSGGKQGLELAQRYPDTYDGILALSPGINYNRGNLAEYWGQLVMNNLGYYPLRCELLAITAAAIEACDGLDGVVDGIISLPGACKFNANTLVGSSFDCGGTTLQFSAEAAQIANAAWEGPHNSTSGKPEWYGLTRDTSLVSTVFANGLLDTVCTNATDASTCTGLPFAAEDWIKFFLLKDPDADLTSLSYAEYDALIQQSLEEYGDIIDTSNPDLSGFRDMGGKMITTQGLADSLIFPNGTIQYYDRVLEKDKAAQDFYRLFLLPGVEHCVAEGPGPYPIDQLGALVKWVEGGEAPDTLTTSFDLASGGKSGERPACMYPAVQTYVGGDPYEASSFTCK